MGKGEHSDEALLLQEEINMNGDYVPEWAYDPDTVKIICEAARVCDKKAARAMDFIGPAVVAGMQANGVVWCLFIVYPWILLAVTQCPQSEGSIAIVPLWAVAASFPCLLVASWLEMRVSRFVLPVYAKTIMDGPTFLGGKLSFWPWAILMISLSTLARMDFVTKSVFVAKALRTSWCSTELEQQWHSVFSNSYVPFMSAVPFWLAAVILWLLMCFQALYVLAHVARIGKVSGATTGRAKADDYDLKMPRADMEGRNWSIYKTLWVDRQTHRAAIFVLADGARMNSVLFQARGYLRTLHGMHFPAQHIFLTLRKQVLWSLLFLTIEAALFLNLQGTLCGIAVSISGDIDMQTVCSIILGAFVNLKGAVEASMAVYSLFKDVQKGQSFKIGDINEKAKVSAKYWLSFFVVVMGLTFFLMFYAIAKSIASCLCPHGLWNLAGCM
jgi:hypothetical protein